MGINLDDIHDLALLWKDVEDHNTGLAGTLYAMANSWLGSLEHSFPETLSSEQLLTECKRMDRVLTVLGVIDFGPSFEEIARGMIDRVARRL